MGRSNKGRRQNKAGRSAVEQYAKLPYVLFRSDAWRSLSGPAVKVFLEVQVRFNGSNNGQLSLSLEEGSRLLGLGKSTVKRALDELCEKGFLALTRRGQFVGRRASTFRLTTKSCNGHPPTDDWRRWRADRPENLNNGSEVAHIGGVTVPYENRGGRLCAM